MLWDVQAVIVPNMVSEVGVLLILIMRRDPKLLRIVKVSQVDRLQVSQAHVPQE